MRAGVTLRLRAAVLLAGLALVLGANRHAHGDEAPRTAAGAEAEVGRALEAARRADDAGVRAAVLAHGGDPVGMAAALLAKKALGASATPPVDADALDAAARVAALYADAPRARGLAPLMAAWSAWTLAELSREKGFHALLGTAKASELVPAQVDSLRTARGSPTAVRVLFARGMRLRKSGADVAAVAALREAVDAADRLPWPLLQSTVRTELAQALLLLEGYGESLATCDAGLRFARDLEALSNVGVFQRARAGALAGLDRLDEALEALGEAYVGRSETFVLSVEAQRSGILSRLGRRAEALALGERVLAAAEAKGEAGPIASALNSLASFEAREGRIARALTLSERARDVLAAAPTTDEVRRLRATTLHNLGSAERNLGRAERAIALFEQAATERRALGLHAAADRSVLQRGTTLEDLGRFDEALLVQRALAARAREAGRADALAQNDVRIVWLLGKTGRAEDARKHAEEALERARTGRVQAGVVDALEIALAAVPADPAEALARLDARLADRPESARPLVVSGREAVRAGLLLTLGRFEEAAHGLRRSFDAYRRRTAGLGDSDLGRSVLSERDVHRALRAARERLTRATTPEDRRRALDDALHATESTRALLLLDGLTNRGALIASRVPPEVVRAERDAQRRLKDALREASRTPGAATPAERERVTTALRDAERDATAAAARVQRELRFGGEVTAPEPVDLAALERGLGAGSTYVALQRMQDELVALVVSGRGADLVLLGPAAPLDARCAAWLDRLAAGADDTALAAALYDALLRPLEAHIAESRRLVIAPDSARARLPFAALLRRTEGAREERVVERWETVFVPSASSWLRLQADAAVTPRGERVVAVGRPTPGTGPAALADLPGSGTEAERIAALHLVDRRTVLLGDKATRQALEAALAPARGRLAALHFAGHALMDDDAPQRSALVLAGGERLGLDDLTELGCPADLAVLSACETAVGKDLEGEGPVGFPRRLFLAGCPRVVVTAWPIADGSALALLEPFHAALAARRVGAAAALREAQRARIAAGDPPAHWAPWLLWGLAE